MSADDKIRVAPLQRDGNYRLWAPKMLALLITKDLDACIEKAPEGGDDEAIVKDAKCKAMLQLHVNGPLVSVVDRAPTAKEAWKALKDEHIGELKVRQPRLMGELNEFKQGKLTVTQYIDKAYEMRDSFVELDMESSLSLLEHQFIRGLNANYRDSWTASLNQIVVDEEQSFDDLMRSFKNLALLLPTDDKPAHVNSTRKETRECYYCKKAGHLIRNCRKRIADEKKNSKAPPPETVLVAKAYITQQTFKDCFWFDTAASSHIVTDEALLFDVEKSSTPYVVLGGNEQHEVSCEGSLRLWGGPEGTVVLTRVLCVPTFFINLISGVKLTDKGTKNVQEGNLVTISKGGLTLLTGSKHDSLYKLHCFAKRSPAPQVNAVSLHQWHRRLGHPCSTSVKKMSENVDGMNFLANEGELKCEVCSVTKQTKETFKRSESSSSTVLQLVHSDVMGPMPLEGLIDEEKYVLTVMDDYSRYADVACIKKKSDVSSNLIEILSRWERQTGNKV